MMSGKLELKPMSDLTGEAEPGVSVEAVGLADCSHYQEEAVTGQDGLYR
jgi:hypothetical protein